jgi:uncharacterized damage-inducible protein DinB
MNRLKWFDKKFQFELSQENFDSILNRLSENPEKISRLVSSLPKEIRIKRIDNRWSIQENVGHLVNLEELHDGRIDDFIAGKEILRPADLNNRGTNEANHNGRKINELLAQLKTVRENFVTRMKQLDVSILSRRSIHPRLNQSMRPIDMAQFVLEHDEHHIQTIKEIISNNQ